MYSLIQGPAEFTIFVSSLKRLRMLHLQAFQDSDRARTGSVILSFWLLMRYRPDNKYSVF